MVHVWWKYAVQHEEFKKLYISYRLHFEMLVYENEINVLYINT